MSDTVFTLYSRLYNRLAELYANERSQAALERSSQDAYHVIRLTRSKDSRRCGAFDRKFLKIILTFTLCSMILRDDGN